MTQPNPNEAGQGSGQGGSGGGRSKSTPKAELLTVGHFRQRDHILGGEHDRYGVVTHVRDGVYTVRPLADHEVDVDAAEFTPLTPDDVTG
jgi:hypothetical protein